MPLMFDAAAPAAAARKPARLSLEDVRALCEECGFQVAGALRRQRFYHVTCTDRMDVIAADGLRPRCDAQVDTNFSDYPSDERSVYLWPSVSIAQHYLTYPPSPSVGATDRAILEVRDVDFGELRPDQEALCDLWAAAEEPEIVALLENVRAAAGDDIPAVGSADLTYEQALDVIDRIDQRMRVLLANVCADRGQPVMVRQAFTPGNVSRLELACIENMSELFYEEFDDEGFDPDDMEAMDARDEQFDDWMVERFPDVEFAAEQDVLDAGADGESQFEDAERRFYVGLPLN
jgi:hypothetical protein